MKLTGLVYCRFYSYYTSETLKKMFISFIRPHLEYTTPVWDPHCVSQIRSLENVQMFSLRMCFKVWNIS